MPYFSPSRGRLSHSLLLRSIVSYNSSVELIKKKGNNVMYGDGVLPYRLCVGIAVFNAVGKVWAGRRRKKEEIWQMPQGGIGKRENPLEAAYRELWEETGMRSTVLIAEGKEWLQYDLPLELIGKSWGGKYRGQKQKWFAMRFLGEESEITIASSISGVLAEFEEWAWVDLRILPQQVVAFKRSVYEQVVTWFIPLTLSRDSILKK